MKENISRENPDGLNLRITKTVDRPSSTSLMQTRTWLMSVRSVGLAAPLLKLHSMGMCIGL